MLSFSNDNFLDDQTLFPLRNSNQINTGGCWPDGNAIIAPDQINRLIMN